MIWGIGTGRCGTKTWAVLNEGFHEPYPLIVEEATRYFIGDRDDGLMERLIGKLRFRHRLRAPVADLKQSLIIPVICEVDPDAHFTWLLREPEACVRSMMQLGYYQPPGEDAPPVVKLHEKWRLASPIESWELESQARKCEWLWRTMNTTCEIDLKKTGAPFEIVLTETLGPKAYNPSVKSNRYNEVGEIQLMESTLELYRKWYSLGSQSREVRAQVQ